MKSISVEAHGAECNLPEREVIHNCIEFDSRCS